MAVAMSALTLTQHAIVRMSQRGIRPRDLELAQYIGTEVEEGILVREKDYRNFERQIKKMLDDARRLVGRRLVQKDGVVVTAYHATTAKERRLLRTGRDAH